MTRQVVVVRQETNGLGLAGLVFSCLGWVTCGLLSFPGVLFSALGLLSRPRGMAFAGLLVGLPGVLLFFVFGFATLAGLVGMNEAVRLERERQQQETNTELTTPGQADTVPEL